MRIFVAKTGDPMLLDTRRELSALHDRFKQFLASSSRVIAFEATITGNPDPYDEFLRGIRVSKSADSATLCISPDRWLELSGVREDLEDFCKRLLVQDDGAHHHFYCVPISLIIEADDEYSEREG